MTLEMDCRDAVRRSLVADVTRSHGRVRIMAHGTSMLPSVLPGDILIASRCVPADLVPGQIVLCYRDQQFVAHRLVGKMGNLFVTRGDSVCGCDLPFREDEVLGEVVLVLRDGYPVDPSPAWWHGVGRWSLRRSTMLGRVLLRLKRLRSSKTARDRRHRGEQSQAAQEALTVAAR
jgi:hypothetical protein